MRRESDSHGFREDCLPVLKVFRSREENAVSVGGIFLRFDCICDCFCDEKISLCLEVVCDENEVARKRSEGCAIYRVHRARCAECRGWAEDAEGCGKPCRSPMTHDALRLMSQASQTYILSSFHPQFCQF